MLHLGSTYLIVRDMDKSLAFYEQLLGMKPTAKNLNRWAQFDFEGHCIALYNNEFDCEMVKSGRNLEQHYNAQYLDYLGSRQITYGNNVVLNFWVEDLRLEYGRLKALAIGSLSEIMYLNIASPYHFFVIEDPDGNTIEITGRYTERA